MMLGGWNEHSVSLSQGGSDSRSVLERWLILWREPRATSAGKEGCLAILCNTTYARGLDIYDPFLYDRDIGYILGTHLDKAVNQKVGCNLYTQSAYG